MPVNQAKPRRRPTSLPPPPAPAASSHGSVRLSADDLHQLALATGLSIISNDSEALERHVQHIRETLHMWVLWSRVGANLPMRGEIADWLSSFDAWIADGITVLGGNAGAGSPAMVEWGEGPAGGALTHLLRGWPKVKPDTWQTNDGAAFRRWIVLTELLRDAGLPDRLSDPRLEVGKPSIEESARCVSEPSPYHLTTDLIRQTLSGLGALRLLARGAAANAEKLPTRPGPDGARFAMVQRLKAAFEALHGRAYTVVVPNEGSHDSTAPTGPALGWTRGLLNLIAKRAAAMPPEHTDKHSGFLELAAWAEKGHALAAVIRKVNEQARRGGRNASTGDAVDS